MVLPQFCFCLYVSDQIFSGAVFVLDACSATARVALEVPAPDPVMVESVEAFMLRVAGTEWLNRLCCREG
jgi:hypothetical protein